METIQLDSDLASLLLRCKKKTREDMSQIAQEIVNYLREHGRDTSSLDPKISRLLATLQDHEITESLNDSGMGPNKKSDEEKKLLIQKIPLLTKQLRKLTLDLCDGATGLNDLPKNYFYVNLHTLLISIELKNSH